MPYPLRLSTTLFLALALSAGAVLPRPGAAQPPAPPQGGDAEETSIFGETADVRVVNLEVVVVDRQGNRVPGLGAEEFRLLVDGKPARIDYFTEVAEGRAARVATAGSAGTAGTGDPGEATAGLLMFGDAGGVEPLKLRFGPVPQGRGKRIRVPLKVVIPHGPRHHGPGGARWAEIRRPQGVLGNLSVSSPEGWPPLPGTGCGIMTN